MKETQPSAAAAVSETLPTGRRITAFICANCAREAAVPTSGFRRRPSLPDFAWPCEAREVLVPCTGRVQPEHLLKALESGADLVCIVACQEDNCHYLEGSRRAQRRADHVGRLLDDIGLGGARLMMFHLPGSARQDMALGAGAEGGPAAAAQDELARRLRAIRDEIVARLKTLPPSPFQKTEAEPEPTVAAYEVEETDESEE
jgi:coenzyme F420-reducing hydrogenase delta subunit